MHQYKLGVVIAMVAQGNFVKSVLNGNIFKKAVSNAPGGFFNGEPMGSLKFRDVYFFDVAG
jgi:hypothetical protein